MVVDGDSVTIDGMGGDWPHKEGTLYIGAGGTTARFLTGVLAASRKGSWKLEASERMSERPMDELLVALSALGASIKKVSPGHSFPLQIEAKEFAGGTITMSGATSSQFLSGVLIASPLSRGAITINICDTIVQQSYVDMTLRLMRLFGADADHNDSFTSFTVHPTPYQGQTLNLEADASTCCYFLSLAALTGGRVRITNIDPSTAQPDFKFIYILEKMGCHIETSASYIEVSGPQQLIGGFSISMRELSDQTLTLAVLAVFANAPITITDVAHIRHHECDRIHVICEELRRAGIHTEELPDGLIITPGVPIPTLFDSHDDHRVAMSLSLLGCRVPGISVRDPGCVSKTCPAFYEEIKKLGMGVSFQ